MFAAFAAFSAHFTENYFSEKEKLANKCEQKYVKWTMLRQNEV